MVVHTCIHSTWKNEARERQVPGKSEIHSDSLICELYADSVC